MYAYCFVIVPYMIYSNQSDKISNVYNGIKLDSYKTKNTFILSDLKSNSKGIQVKFILSQHSKCTTGNSEKQFSLLVSCI